MIKAGRQSALALVNSGAGSSILRSLGENEVLQIPIPTASGWCWVNPHVFTLPPPSQNNRRRTGVQSEPPFSLCAGGSAPQRPAEYRLNGHLGQETTMSAAAAASLLMKDNDTKGTEARKPGDGWTSQHAPRPVEFVSMFSYPGSQS